MNLKRLVCFIVFAHLVTTHVFLSAHHSTVAYAKNSIVLKNATITKVVWADPHMASG